MGAGVLGDYAADISSALELVIKLSVSLEEQTECFWREFCNTVFQEYTAFSEKCQVTPTKLWFIKHSVI